jgi:hypothetical protein
VPPFFFRAAHIGLLCFAVSARYSFERVTAWHEQLIEYHSKYHTPVPAVCVVGLQTDHGTAQPFGSQLIATAHFTHHLWSVVWIRARTRRRSVGGRGTRCSFAGDIL